VANPGVSREEAVENIDIGGPSMLRSAAKNYRSVCAICDPSDYGRVIAEMEKSDGCVPEALLEELGVKVFARTAEYDAAIFKYLSGKNPPTIDKADAFPEVLDLAYRKLQDLRYGENPHQKAAFYKDSSVSRASIANAVQLHGKELSFNNIIDLDAALEMVKELEDPAAVIIKHTNPCGAATAKDCKAAYIAALDCDRLSAFGSIVGFNRPVDHALAKTILEEADFVECVIAPSYDMKALEALKSKKNLRVLEVKGFGKNGADHQKDMKKVSGGMLLQDRDTARLKESDIKVVTRVKPTKDEMKSLMFGWMVAKHVKSNAIVLCRGTKTVGIGAGQMSRVDSVMIASRKAGPRSNGATLASDAFFPKEDGIEEAAKAGVKAVIQPGGSIRDKEVIAAADRLGVSMIFTGVRHFKH
jgi:phosphoribosylaminoimidazolecarboxamide formyltransferase/IMP cyclohydrolase